MPVDFDPGAFKDTVLGGKWRFILLIVFFDILLIAMSLLTLHQGELTKKQIILRTINVEYEQRLKTEVVTTTRVITIVVPSRPQ